MEVTIGNLYNGVVLSKKFTLHFVIDDPILKFISYGFQRELHLHIHL